MRFQGMNIFAFNVELERTDVFHHPFRRARGIVWRGPGAELGGMGAAFLHQYFADQTTVFAKAVIPHHSRRQQFVLRQA
jgi:hypothetical protein